MLWGVQSGLAEGGIELKTIFSSYVYSIGISEYLIKTW